MILYHGSNIIVEKPRILQNLRALDFGAGFYLTSSKEQAKKWGTTVSKNREEGVPTVNTYSFDTLDSTSLKILEFTKPDGKWLDFVVANRKELAFKVKYDLVIGPVANDTTLTVINDYMSGRFSKRDAIRFLKPQKLTDQYCFLSDKALSLLVFKGSEQWIPQYYD